MSKARKVALDHRHPTHLCRPGQWVSLVPEGPSFAYFFSDKDQISSRCACTIDDDRKHRETHEAPRAHHLRMSCSVLHGSVHSLHLNWNSAPGKDFSAPGRRGEWLVVDSGDLHSVTSTYSWCTVYRFGRIHIWMSCTLIAPCIHSTAPSRTIRIPMM